MSLTWKVIWKFLFTMLQKDCLHVPQSHRTIASIFLLLPSNCQFGKNEFVGPGTFWAARDAETRVCLYCMDICFIVISIVKRCQCHQAASIRDHGINFQGKRYPSSVRSVCRRQQEEIIAMQYVVPFLCLTHGLQPWTVCPCCRQCEYKFNWMTLKNCFTQIQFFQWRTHSKIIISVQHCLLTWILQPTLSFVHLPLHYFCLNLVWGKLMLAANTVDYNVHTWKLSHFWLIPYSSEGSLCCLCGLCLTFESSDFCFLS